MHAGAPHELLDQIFSSTKQIMFEGQLSTLYHDALTQLFRNDKEQQLFIRVFGAMTVLQESLPLHDFARLLGIKSEVFNPDSLRFRQKAYCWNMGFRVQHCTLLFYLSYICGVSLLFYLHFCGTLFSICIH